MTDFSHVHPNLTIRDAAIDRLIPSKRNARTHSSKQIRQIADSIKAFGFTNPILVDVNGNVVCGHGRLAGAKHLGMTTVPTIVLDNMTDAQRRAYAIADNRLAELAGWDKDLLKIEFEELSLVYPDLDLTFTGFATGEIDAIVIDSETSQASGMDGLPNDDHPTVSRLGDLWELGPHRLLCGDARNAQSYEKLLAGEAVRMVLTDPPYNVRVEGHVRRSQGHSDFIMASGEMTEAEFISFLMQAFQHMAAVSLPGAVHTVFMDWRHLSAILTAGGKIYDALLNICVWVKGNGGMGSLYRSEHELALIWRVKGASHLNNVELGRHGRNRTNVWRFNGANGFGPERAEMLALHPTVKPVAMLSEAILDVTKRGDVVLDPFAGSGSTMIAAHQVGRRTAAIELDPHYVDVALRRFQEVTGIQPRHAATGRSFEEERAIRSVSAPSGGETSGSDREVLS